MNKSKLIIAMIGVLLLSGEVYAADKLKAVDKSKVQQVASEGKAKVASVPKESVEGTKNTNPNHCGNEEEASKS